MNAAIDIDRLIPAWQSLLAEAPICHIESEEDYEQVTVVLNRLLDVVRDDITHPRRATPRSSVVIRPAASEMNANAGCG